MPLPVPPAGRHVLAEIAGVPADVLDDVDALRAALTSALAAAGATVRQVVAERFVPRGATLVAVLAESHASVHTWPEHGTALVDVFTCGDAAEPRRAVELLAAALGGRPAAVTQVQRGGPPGEVLEPIAPGLTRRWELGRVHADLVTPYQHVLIADTAHGVTLFCDGERQSAEATQLVYHEALFVPAVLRARRRDRVLVIGSGEGVVSELAVAVGARHVDHVDVDAAAVRACAEHLPYGYTPAALAAAQSGRGPVHLHYGDGRAWVEAYGEPYDVIVVDLPDERPDEPGNQLNRLYTASFLAACRDRLAPGGVVVSQAGSPALWRDATLRAAWRRFGEVFDEVGYYGSDEHEWAFLTGGAAATHDPAAALPGLGYVPVSVDIPALRSRSVPPRALR